MYLNTCLKKYPAFTYNFFSKCSTLVSKEQYAFALGKTKLKMFSHFVGKRIKNGYVGLYQTMSNRLYWSEIYGCCCWWHYFAKLSYDPSFWTQKWTIIFGVKNGSFILVPDGGGHANDSYFFRSYSHSSVVVFQCSALLAQSSFVVYTNCIVVIKVCFFWKPTSCKVSCAQFFQASSFLWRSIRLI